MEGFPSFLWLNNTSVFSRGDYLGIEIPDIVYEIAERADLPVGFPSVVI